MQRFLDHWLYNIVGLVVIGFFVGLGWILYREGYDAGRSAGFNSVHEQLMNPCRESSRPRPCFK